MTLQAIGETRPRQETVSERPPVVGVLPAAVWRSVLVGGLALFFGIGLLAAVWVFARPLALLLAAVVLAQAVAPIVERLARWMPRPAAIGLVYLVLLAVAGAVTWVAATSLAERVMTAIEQAPLLLDRAFSVFDTLNPALGDAAMNALLPRVSDFTDAISDAPLVVLTAVFETLLVLAVSIYWLGASRRLIRFVLSLVPPSRRRLTGTILRELGLTMGGYLRARVLVGLISGAAMYAALLLFGIEYAGALALLTGVGKLIPLIGVWLAAIPLAAIALLVASPAQAVGVLVVYGLVHQVASYVLLPMLTGEQADIPPVLALIALLAGGFVGGFLGLLLAIPLAGALRVLLIRLVVPAVRRWARAYDGNHAAPAAATGTPAAVTVRRRS